jgi:hypothetical protein
MKPYLNQLETAANKLNAFSRSLAWFVNTHGVFYKKIKEELLDSTFYLYSLSCAEGHMK